MKLGSVSVEGIRWSKLRSRGAPRGGSAPTTKAVPVWVVQAGN